MAQSSNGFDPKTLVGQTVKRSLAIVDPEKPVYDKEKRTVRLAIFSDEPQLDLIGRSLVYVKLSMNDGAINLERFQGGLAFTENHDPKIRLGRAREPGVARVATDKILFRAVARFSSRPYSDELFKEVIEDIDNGDVPNTSGIARIDEVAPKPIDNIDGIPVVLATKWTPFECCIATIGKDGNTGIGRAMSTDNPEHTDEDCDDPECAVHRKEPITPATTVNRSTIMTEAERLAAAERAASPLNTMTERQTAYETFALKFATTDDQKAEMTRLARDMALSAKTEDDLFGEIKRTIADWNTKVPPAGPSVDLTKKEREGYSICRAILAAVERKEGKFDKCFEMEVSDEILKNRPTHTYRGGILIPTDQPLGRAEVVRSGLDTGTATKGPEVVFTEPRGFIDLLRAKMKVRQLGAQVLSGLQGNIAIPRQTGSDPLYWVAENSGTDVTEGDPTLDQVLMSPKTGMGYRKYSRQLLAQGTIDVDSFVKNDLSIIGALGIDKAAIHGSGNSNQPKGIYAQSGVNTESFASSGTTPGVITFPHVVNMETKIAEVDGDVSAMAYLTTPGVRGTAKQTPVLDNTIARALWQDNMMNGYRAEVSNQVSKMLGAGSDNGLVFGCWDQIIIGEWGAIEITTDPYTLMGQAMVRVFLFLMVDVAVRHPEAFTKATYLKAA
jgi:HK97 family phage major capsid protein